jgi:hypothetical protein
MGACALACLTDSNASAQSTNHAAGSSWSMIFLERRASIQWCGKIGQAGNERPQEIDHAQEGLYLLARARAGNSSYLCYTSPGNADSGTRDRMALIGNLRSVEVALWRLYPQAVLTKASKHPAQVLGVLQHELENTMILSM